MPTKSRPPEAPNSPDTAAWSAPPRSGLVHRIAPVAQSTANRRPVRLLANDTRLVAPTVKGSTSGTARASAGAGILAGVQPGGQPPPAGPDSMLWRASSACAVESEVTTPPLA